MVTIRDVAKKAKVSKCTVSHALNRPELVAEATRMKVLKAVETLGYHPSRMAIGLSKGMTYNIAAVCTGGPRRYDRLILYEAEVMDGIRDIFMETEYHLVLLYADSYPDEKKLLTEKIMQQKGADGVILIGSRLTGKEVGAINISNLPVVFVNREYWGQNIGSVRIDNKKATASLLQYLIGLGHRKIAFVGYDPEHRHHAIEKRWESYREVMKETGIDYDDSLVVELKGVGKSALEVGAEAVKDLMEKNSKFTAVYCVGDGIAVGVMKALKARGIAIPLDVSVTGFDDSVLAEFSDPPLTTVRQPMFELGRESAIRLLRKLRGEDDKIKGCILKTELVIRDSCSSPKN